MAAGSIIIDLLMRTGSFETDTKRAQKALKDMEREAEKIGKAIGVAMAAAGTAAVLLVRNAINSADEMSKMAQKVGIGTEALSELTYAAKLSDVSFEELGASMVKFAKGISDAAQGTGEAQKAFAALGLSIKNADGSLKSQDVLLAEMADKFAGFADGVEKTALAVAAFGRSGASMIPLLNGGSAGLRASAAEARALGAVLTGEAGKAAEDFNDNLTRLQTAVLGLVNQITIAMLPRMVELTNSFVDFVKDGDKVEQLAKDIGDVLSWAGEQAKTAAMLFAQMSTRIRELGLTAGATAAILDKLFLSGEGPGKFKGAAEIFRQWRADIIASEQALISFQNRVASFGTSNAAPMSPGLKAMAIGMGLNDIERAAGPSVVKPNAPRMSGSGSGSKEKQSEAERYLENLRKQLQGTQDLTVAEAVRADIQAGRLGKVLPAQEKELLNIARQIDAAKASEKAMDAAMKAAQERSDARQAEDKAITESIRAAEEADRARLDSLTGGTYVKELQKVTADVQFLNRAYEDGKISVELWAEAVTQATGRLQQQAEEVDSVTKLMQERVQGFLGDTLLNAMEGNFKGIGRAFTRMLNGIIAELVAADLAKRMFGSSAGGSGSGWIGAAIGWASTAFGGTKAGGGDVMPGRSYWVGEQGPERFVPRTMGKILPAGAGAGAGGSTRTVNVTNNFTVAGNVDRRTQTQLAAEAARSLRFADGRAN